MSVTQSHSPKRTRKDSSAPSARLLSSYYQLLFEHSRDMILFVRLSDGRILEANRAAEQAYGYTRIELLALTIRDLRSPETQAQIGGQMQQASSAGILFETWHQRKDGFVFPVEVNSFGTELDGEKINLSIIRDISARKRTEQALQASEARFRTLIESAPVAVSMVRNGLRIYANQRYMQMWGYPSDAEIIGQPLTEQIAPEGRPEIIKINQQLERGELAVNELETNGQRPDGSQFPFHAAITRVDLADGPATLGFFYDISDRMQAEEELKQRLAELEFLSGVSKEVRSAENQPALFGMMLERLHAVLGTRGAALAFPDPDLAGWMIGSAVGEWRDALGTHISTGSGVGPRVAASQHYYLSSAALTDPLLSEQERAPGMACLFCIALVTNKRTVGLLYLGRDTPFLRSDARLVVATLDMVAGAMKRIELDQQTLRQVDRLVALRDIDQAILNRLSMNETLLVLLEKTTRLLNVDAANILLYHPDRQALQACISWGMAPSLLWDEQLQLGESHAGRVALSRRMEWVPDLNMIHDRLTEKVTRTGEKFVSYLAIPLEVKGELKGVLQIFHRSTLTPNRDWMDFLRSLTGQAALAIDHALLRDEQAETLQTLVQAYDKTIEGVSRALDLRDKETGDHSQRLAQLTLALASRLGVKEADLVHLQRGAQLHDIGKMGIPDAILWKPGALTEAEWAVMRQHPLHAARLLSPIEFLRLALDIPYGHHEKWDGSGYPQGLKGEAIPLAARIFAVVDVWDALTHDRPYRKAWTEQAALDFIKAQSGVHFDPKVVEVFLEMM
jgi:PAS domain S-box-containing protein